MSRLPPGRCLHTAQAAIDWCDWTVAETKKALVKAEEYLAVYRPDAKLSPLRVVLRPTRRPAMEMLHLEVLLNTEWATSVTFLCSGGYHVGKDYRHSRDHAMHVPDMSEALHLAGIIVRKLGIKKIEVGYSLDKLNIGKRDKLRAGLIARLTSQ